jgi:peptidoglycan/LPS O-acetylase OafA/YrhL
MDGQLQAASDAVDYLAYAIAHTSADPAAAYVVTPTRAWELGAGALLALAAPSIGRPPR